MSDKPMNYGDFKAFRRQRGVALLTVMFIMVLLTTLVVYLVEDDHLAIRRVSSQQESEQGFHAAVYAEQWARKVLEADIRENEVDHLAEPWNEERPELGENDTARLEARVADLQGRFNINNLASDPDERWYAAFQRLLTVLEIDVGLADAVVDWVDADINVKGHAGAEDAEYLLKDPSHRAANRLMADTGELAWVHGMTGESLEKLAPHVAALPAVGVGINVNTASVEVLQILTPDILDEGAAEGLVAGRGDNGYDSVATFLVMGVLAGHGDVVEPLVSVRSEFFEVRSRVQLGRHDTVLYSVIERPAGTRQANVVQRRRGIS